MRKTVRLNVWQRIMCLQALNQQTGHITFIHKALRLVDVFELSAEEGAAVGLVDDGQGNYRWQDTETTFELEIKDRELLAFLKRALMGYQGWPVTQGALALDLFEQFGIELPAGGEAEEEGDE